MTQSSKNPIARQTCQAIFDLAKSLDALKFGDFILSSGQHSSYYFDGRLLSLDSRGAGLLGDVVVDIAQRYEVAAVGGPTIAADPIVGAALFAASKRNIPIRGFLVRGQIKDHGTGKLVEGPFAKGSPVMVLDDTCSTGGSLLQAVKAIEAEGCKVSVVMCVLDRHQGGSEKLTEMGYPFISLLEADPVGNVRITP
ncbi:MAG: orotate phosphoribosyltransferase [Dehalococcoidia bacterium]|nr:orotate phosphoribosyltransferase [Dehalococcoidia bacterium]